MAQLTGFPESFHGDTTKVDTSALITPGTRAKDTLGNEWIYIQGTASVQHGTWVVFKAVNTNYPCALLGDPLGHGGRAGPVAIFGTTVVAGQYGWAQICGVNNQARLDTTAANTQLYIDDTAGRADDADAAGSAIIGAVALAADASNVGTVWINYPFVNDGDAID